MDLKHSMFRECGCASTGFCLAWKNLLVQFVWIVTNQKSYNIYQICSAWSYWLRSNFAPSSVHTSSHTHTHGDTYFAVIYECGCDSSQLNFRKRVCIDEWSLSGQINSGETKRKAVCGACSPLLSSIERDRLFKCFFFLFFSDYVTFACVRFAGAALTVSWFFLAFGSITSTCCMLTLTQINFIFIFILIMLCNEALIPEK